ncbi:MAG: hypothetical protein J6A69_08885 [Clostridia bacterium]|nr:hypothetical protein [Clostridia bacterium]
MNNYERPMLNVVELQIDEHIAALVPKTIYKKRSGTSSTFDRDTVTNSEVAELEEYGTSNQTA